MFKKYYNIVTNMKKINKFILLGVFAVILGIGLIANHHHRTKYIKEYLDLPILDENSDHAFAEETNEWTYITAKPNDTLSKIFANAGISQKVMYDVLNNNKFAKQLTTIKPNQQVQFLIKNGILEKIVFPINLSEILIVTRHDKIYLSKIKAKAMDLQEDFASATVHGSLYASAQRNNVSFKLIQQMINIFEWEINFSKDIRDGDKFNILYNSYYIDGSKVKTGDIIAVEYISKNKSLRAVSYKNSNGETAYYTPEGASLKKAFTRYPIKYSHISSNFSTGRRHPILHYVRSHKGIDLAARLGTPILATGDGVIKSINYENGYGNVIKISHYNIYTSVYAHLLKFQKGLSRGSRVKRGQVIGYVGQSGLATGPHCHYEFHVNQRPQNPSTIKLPQGLAISQKEKPNFNFKTSKLIANLKLYDATKVADAKANYKSNTG